MESVKFKKTVIRKNDDIYSKVEFSIFEIGVVITITNNLGKDDEGCAEIYLEHDIFNSLLLDYSLIQKRNGGNNG